MSASPVLQIRLPEDLLSWVKEQADAERLEPSRWVRQRLQDLQLAATARSLVEPIAAKFNAQAADFGVALVSAPIPCRCGGKIYQVGKLAGKCSNCSRPKPA